MRDQHNSASPDICESDAWKQAALTPWSRKMLGLATDRLRLVLKRYVRAG